MDKTQLSDRMKDNYEKRARTYLTRRTPVIMRLDGKAFHTFTKGMERPFDATLNNIMRTTALKLCQEIQGAKCAYVQSDEISILITDYDKLNTDAWYDYQTQKMCSISAAIATAEFNKQFWINNINSMLDLNTNWETGNTDLEYFDYSIFKKTAYFDSRVFNIPKEEVNNYFVYRQIDWVRNSIQLAGQSVFSHAELFKKNTTEIKQMLWDEYQITWENYEDKWKNGSFCVKNEESGGWKFSPLAPRFAGTPAVVNRLAMFKGA